MPLPSYGADQMRDMITRALLEVQSPSPRMPGGGMGAPTQGPVVPPGVTAPPQGAPGASGMPPSPPGGGVQGPQMPGMPGPSPGALAPAPPGMGPPQVPPPQMGGAPIPPVPRSQNLVGQPPPGIDEILGTQLPPGGRY
jgi:hypothetical protein